MKKQKIKEGTLFSVVVKEDVFVVGLVARIGNGGIFLGYFFPERFDHIPSLDEIGKLSPKNAVLITKPDLQGFNTDLWKVIGEIPDWNPEKWPLPDFVHYSPLGNESPRRRSYVLPELFYPSSEVTCTVSEAAKLPEDGFFGYGAVSRWFLGFFSYLVPPPTSFLGKVSGVVRFYLYFSNETDGKNLLSILEKDGFTVEDYNILEGGNRWSLLISKRVKSESELDKLEEELNKKALQFNGEYDGYERGVGN